MFSLALFLLPASVRGEMSLNFQGLNQGFKIFEQMMSIQQTAEAAKSCALRYVSEEKLNKVAREVEAALPKIRTYCDQGNLAQAKALAKSFERDPQIRLANAACDHYRPIMVEQMAQILGQVPANLSSSIYAMIRDLQRTPEHPCP